ncbi:FISUMP domain-containing protein [Aquimarina celericrescens]|uniref:FISUMP domain-containing protein n=1 Tax=Aquimarina celericrescens TaxID=1964542 RepID=A0ABW5ATA2_9FLAO|nr:hypothetical protein [Aquimarina celericrescens]
MKYFKGYLYRDVLLIMGALFIVSCSSDDSDSLLFEVDSKVTDITCSNSGSIDLIVSGGTPPYSFLWSTNQTTEDITNITSEGTFNVTIADSNGLTKILSIDVKRVDSRIRIEAEINNSDLFTNNGSISLTVTGGVPPYEYVWSNSETVNSISNLEPGRYEVEVSDANKCLSKEAFTIQALEVFTDGRDGKNYTMIRNGDQVWMYEPLNFETASGSSFIFDDPDNADKGRLYTWETIMNGERFDPANPSDIQGLCPEGWHIPSVAEWKVFEEFLKTQKDQFGNVEWSRVLVPNPRVTFYLVDFRSGVQWRDEGFTTFITNTSDTFVWLEFFGSLEYKSTTIEPDIRYWTEYKHFCHCIKNKD